MAHYMVTLVIETDPSEGDPGLWGWCNVLDTPYPVTVVASSRVPDYPTDDDTTRVHRTISDAHDSLVGVLTGTPAGAYGR